MEDLSAASNRLHWLVAKAAKVDRNWEVLALRVLTGVELRTYLPLYEKAPLVKRLKPDEAFSLLRKPLLSKHRKLAIE